MRFFIVWALFWWFMTSWEILLLFFLVLGGRNLDPTSHPLLFYASGSHKQKFTAPLQSCLYECAHWLSPFSSRSWRCWQQRLYFGWYSCIVRIEFGTSSVNHTILKIWDGFIGKWSRLSNRIRSEILWLGPGLSTIFPDIGTVLLPTESTNSVLNFCLTQFFFWTK